MRTTGIIAIIAAVVVFVSPAYCEEETAVIEIRGPVVEVNTDINELTIKNAEGVNEMMEVGDTTVITKDGKSIKLADIQTGDNITAEAKDGKITSIKIEAATVTEEAPLEE